MKKILFSLLILAVFSSASFAATFVGVGARASGMGGCGVATSNDLSAAYYNPAGLMRSEAKIAEGRFALGGSTQGLTDLINSMSTAGDPAKFMADSYDSEIDVDGSGVGIIGGAINKIGLSFVPDFLLSMDKPKNSADGIVLASGGGALALTFGTTIGSLPLGSIDVGANVKYVARAMGSYASSLPTSYTTTSYGTGIGLDLGARADVEVPAVSKLSVGIALRDMFETINYTDKTNTQTWSGDDYTEVSGPEEDRTETSPTTLAVGAAATLPVLGTLFTGEMDMLSGDDGYTITRFGVEHPLIMNFLLIRAGYAGGKDLAITTLGVGFHVGINIDLAYAIDGNDSKNNSAVLEGSFAL